MNSTVHVCIDVQVDLLDDPALRNRIGSFVSQLVPLNIPTLFIAFSNGMMAPVAVSAMAKLTKQEQRWLNRNLLLPLQPNSLVAIKDDYSAYPMIAEWLVRQQPVNVILTGVAETCCLAKTAKDCAANGYSVRVPAELTDGSVRRFCNLTFQHRRGYLQSLGAELENQQDVLAGLCLATDAHVPGGQADDGQIAGPRYPVRQATALACDVAVLR